MPWGAAVETNGLKSWVIVLSGELSMTSCWDLLVVDEPVPELAADEHAPSPAARRPAAATMMSLLWLSDLLVIFVFPVVRKVR
jgi:hypothetical protein